MASTSRFREVSEDDVENVLQSAIPDKNKKATKYGMKIFKDKRKKISEMKCFLKHYARKALSKKSNNYGSCFVLDRKKLQHPLNNKPKP